MQSEGTKNIIRKNYLKIFQILFNLLLISLDIKEYSISYLLVYILLHNLGNHLPYFYPLGCTYNMTI